MALNWLDREKTVTHLFPVEVLTCDGCGKEAETVLDEGERSYSAVKVGWAKTGCFKQEGYETGSTANFCPDCWKRMTAAAKP